MQIEACAYVTFIMNKLRGSLQVTQYNHSGNFIATRY